MMIRSSAVNSTSPKSPHLGSMYRLMNPGMLKKAIKATPVVSITAGVFDFSLILVNRHAVFHAMKYRSVKSDKLEINVQQPVQ